MLAEDGWTWIETPGWTQVGGEGAGVWNVTIDDFDPVIAPEGENVVYTENAPEGVANGVAEVLGAAPEWSGLPAWRPRLNGGISGRGRVLRWSHWCFDNRTGFQL
ncbi:MAG: hypothetical protein ISS79_04515 [Phycisphaerae bacterium]|nr:hypothetical protein [Phycisphaerae bacterium]